MLIRPNIVTNVVDNIQSVLDRNLIGTYVPTSIITTTKAGTFSVTLRCINDAVFNFNWGDGSAIDKVTLPGSTLVAVNHSYADASEKIIKIYNEIDKLDVIAVLTNMSITGIDFTHLPGSMSQIYMPNNGISDISSLSHIKLLITTNTLVLFNNPISYPLSGIKWTKQTVGVYRFDSTVSSLAEVDQMLIDFAAAGWNNCTIYVDGTNPARTSASDTALGTLITNGCIVYVNE